jgi:D-threonine aldolase
VARIKSSLNPNPETLKMFNYQLVDEAQIASPALIFYPELIRQNLHRVVELVGTPERLRPHVKTHKTREITQLQLEQGVTKHKCATIAEAEMLAQVGVPDVLIAYPLVGPNLQRLTQLVQKYPRTEFSALLDHPSTVEGLAKAAEAGGRTVGYFVDLDVGQHRTGIAVKDNALSLYLQAAKSKWLIPRGLHAYDGQNNQESRADREAAARAGLAPVLALREKLQLAGVPAPSIIAGGTPTFPVYAAIRDIPGLECSPGTYVLHDHGYGSKFTDFTGITPAAVLLTRVISRPMANRVTFDLGNKAVAADPLMVKRVHLLNVPEYTIVGHNEEHLIVEMAEANRFTPGDVVYALPGHVCPTCALHREALIAEGGRITGQWSIASRDRVLTV